MLNFFPKDVSCDTEYLQLFSDRNDYYVLNFPPFITNGYIYKPF